MAQVNYGLWMGDLQLDAGASATWFEDDVAPTKVRWFTVVPINTLIDDFVMSDQKVEITEVFHILKGRQHTLDGSGGMGTLQVNVTVQNLDPENAASFEIYKAETE